MSASRAGETLAHLTAAYGSLVRSRSQTALALAALAGASTLSPAAALACGAAASLMLATRPLAMRPTVGSGASGFPGRGRSRTPRFAVALDADGQEIALDAEGMRGGLVVAGGTRADRVSALLRLAEEALANASGFVLFDGGDTPRCERAVWDLAHRYGREDDVLIIDMREHMQGRGNLFAPLATLDADRIVQIVVDLMDEAGGDGAMWKGRATAMFTGVTRLLCWQRDAKGRPIDYRTLSEALNLRAIVAAVDRAGNPDLPEEIRQVVRGYLTTLPGFNEDRGVRQAQTTLDQHGYLEMQFTKILGGLSYLYGNDTGFRAPDIDLADVVRGRRILLVRYPAGFSEAVGCRLVLGALKIALAEAAEREGRPAPAAVRAPFLVLQDEAQDYVVPGLADRAGRGGPWDLSMVYASQSLPALKRLSEREAESIIANTNTRIFMRTEEMGIGARGRATGVTSFGAAPGMRPLGEGEAASIIPSTNTKIFMRVEEMEADLGGDGSGPGVEGSLPVRAFDGARSRDANRFLARDAA